MPALGAADTNVRPAGSRSVTTTPVALLGPLLVAVTVNVTLVFWFGVALLTVLVTAMSACDTMLVRSLAVSLVVFVWLPPLTLAWLVTEFAALWRTVTVTVMDG